MVYVLRKVWDNKEVILSIGIIGCLILTGYAFISATQDAWEASKAEKAAEIASAFEISGTVESVREAHEIHRFKGLLGTDDTIVSTTYATIDGEEFEVNSELIPLIESGQQVTVKGNSGEILSVEIIK